MRQFLWPFRSSKCITVEPQSVNDRPKSEYLLVGYGRWSLTRIEPQGCLFREDVQRQHAFDYSNPRQVWIPDSVTGFQSLSVKLGFWIPVVN